MFKRRDVKGATQERAGSTVSVMEHYTNFWGMSEDEANEMIELEERKEFKDLERLWQKIVEGSGMGIRRELL